MNIENVVLLELTDCKHIINSDVYCQPIVLPNNALNVNQTTLVNVKGSTTMLDHTLHYRLNKRSMELVLPHSFYRPDILLMD